MILVAKIVVPLKPPSLNDWNNKNNSRFIYMNVKKKWTRWIPPANYDQHADGFRFVTVTRFMRGRERAYDGDNLVGGFKPVADILVKHRFLLGDTEDSVLITYGQTRGEKSETVIEVFKHGES